MKAFAASDATPHADLSTWPCPGGGMRSLVEAGTHRHEQSMPSCLRPPPQSTRPRRDGVAIAASACGERAGAGRKPYAVLLQKRRKPPEESREIQGESGRGHAAQTSGSSSPIGSKEVHG